MNINYIVIVAIITYIVGSITKLKWVTIPTKFIPLQNVFIAFISSLICYFTKIEPTYINSLIYCFMATMGAGGVYDLIKTLKK